LSELQGFLGVLKSLGSAFESFFSNITQPANTIISIVSGAGFITILILTKPGKEVVQVDDYYDAAIGKFIQHFDVKLKFAGNPLFKKITVFEYEGEKTYEITAMEFGSHEKILVPGAYVDKPKKDHREITITEKSMLAKRKVPLLKIETENDPPVSFVVGITCTVLSDRIDLRNVNSSPVKHYPVSCSVRLSAAQRRGLMSNQKVEDVYPKDNTTVIVVREIPAARMGRPAVDSIRF
jgi:hypothetical protein